MKNTTVERKPGAKMLHPFRVHGFVGYGTYPWVEPVAHMWDPVGVLCDWGGTYLIPGLKPGAWMLHPFRLHWFVGNDG